MVSRNAVSTESFGMHTPKNFVPKKFKAIIRETTVYQYIAELKQDSFTELGFFDLAQVPELYIIGAGQFLRDMRTRHNNLTQKKIGKLVNRHKTCIAHWERGAQGIPLKALVKITKICGVSKDSIYSLIDQGKFVIGKEQRLSLPVRFDKLREIVHHFLPQQYHRKDVRVCNYSEKELSKIKAMLNVQPKYNKGNSSMYVYSTDLHNYLTTFFQYEKVYKIKPPLTSEVKTWHEKGVDLKRAIIIPCLQSDGGIGQRVHHNRIRFFSNDKVLHNYFVDAMYFAYNLMPTSYMLPMKNERRFCYETTYKLKEAKSIIAEVMNLAGNAKAGPANSQTVDEYLKEPQPHLNYLITAPATEQKIALRIWATTEGNVSVHRDGSTITPNLEIACAHPILAQGLHQVARRFNINLCKHRSKKTWSRIRGMSSCSLRSFIEFLKIGGFIEGVRISMHSKYHEGIAKDILSLGLLEFILRLKEEPKLRKVSTEKIHAIINEIIDKKEYRSKTFYIWYFS